MVRQETTANKHFQIPIQSWNAQAFQTSSCELLVFCG